MRRVYLLFIVLLAISVPVRAQELTQELYDNAGALYAALNEKKSKNTIALYSFVMGMEAALTTANGKLRHVKRAQLYCQPMERRHSFPEMLDLFIEGYKTLLIDYGPEIPRTLPPGIVLLDALERKYPC